MKKALLTYPVVLISDNFKKDREEECIIQVSEQAYDYCRLSAISRNSCYQQLKGNGSGNCSRTVVNKHSFSVVLKSTVLSVMFPRCVKRHL